MQSYASPGRVITVTNSGPDAVAVRADQPYRLGNLIGVTEGPAGVGDGLLNLNLCVEGVFEQMVDLADGVEAAEAGTPVLMNVATFALVAGLTDATDHVHFGVLAERMTRRRVVLVKLMPAAAAAPATGGGDGGEGGTPGAPDYLDAPCIADSGAVAVTPNGTIFTVPFYEVVKAQGRDCHVVAPSGPNLPTLYFEAEKSGWFEFAIRMAVGASEPPPSTGIRFGVLLSKYNQSGNYDTEYPGEQQVIDDRGFMSWSSTFQRIYVQPNAITHLNANDRVAIRMYRANPDLEIGGFDPGGVSFQYLTVMMRRVA
jgi:hypothetical protein